MNANRIDAALAHASGTLPALAADAPTSPATPEAPPSPRTPREMLARTVTMAELAAMLQCSVRTVKRLVRDGKIPGVIQLGNRLVRFERSRIDHWFSDGCPGLTRRKG